MSSRPYACHHGPPPALLASLLVMTAALLTALLPHHASAQTYKVTDGFLQQNMAYTQVARLDLTGLDKTRKVSSTATVRNGKIQNQLFISGGTGATPSDTFATSLYMTLTKMHIACTASGVQCYYYIEYLPPNAYILLKETTSYKTDGFRSIAIQTGWDYNTTLLVQDSTLENNGSGPQAFLTFGPSNGDPLSLVDNCVFYVKKMKVSNHQGILEFKATLEQQSAIVFEDVEGINLKGAMLMLKYFKILDHSAIIMNRVKNTHTTNSELKVIMETGSLEVDPTSVFALIDVDGSNNFKGTTADFVSGNTVITGGGEVVFSRIIMQKTGLHTMQPVDNSKFWVSARMKAGVDMTVDEIRAQNLNAVSERHLNWDGTQADGSCAPVGASIPGRATYKLVDGKCTATCDEGFVPPACTAPAKSQCRVDNCDLCYRVTKTKCMMCAAHTKIENSDQVCRCPANLEHCQVCPSESTCDTCVEGYNLTKGGAPCFPCSVTVPHCFHCDEPNVCAQCVPHYNVSSDKKACYSCPAENCLHCDGEEVCDQCIPHYNLSAIGEPQNRCFHCNLPRCVLCKDEGTCAKCIDGYSVPQGGTECISCPIAHCERCDADSVCAQCKDKHTPDGGKRCYPCTMPGCLKCDDDEQCVACDDKYTLVGKKCISCDIAHCKSCSTDAVCDQCEPKHTLHNEGSVSECIPCGIDGCAACDSDSHCSACANGNPPVDDGQECVSCKVSGCMYCNATDSCAECKDRYSIAAVEAAGKLTCTSCNIDHCLFCGAADTCLECEVSYNISKNGARCNSCLMSNCQRCDEDGVCAQCDATLSVSLNGGECTPCDIGNCTYCAQAGECGMCECGLVPTSDGKKCVLCTAANCKHCELPGDGTKCAECIKGYDVADGSCRKSGLPSWVVFLIVVAITVVLVTAFCLGVFFFLRHQAEMRQNERDAEERRRNRQAKGRGTRHHTEIGILDLGDIEGAASGVRDNQGKYNAVF